MTFFKRLLLKAEPDPAPQPCPIPHLDESDIHGHDLGNGSTAIGRLCWDSNRGEWLCLARNKGSLCISTVSVEKVE